tara:strand:- start:28 stop:156 length:129 start_codon:yes stop_codon:yes gene_type:complete
MKYLKTGAMVLFLAPIWIPVLVYMGLIFIADRLRTDDDTGRL